MPLGYPIVPRCNSGLPSAHIAADLTRDADGVAARVHELDNVLARERETHLAELLDLATVFEQIRASAETGGDLSFIKGIADDHANRLRQRITFLSRG